MAVNPKSLKNLRPFEKGDPRINRGGQPKSFLALRKLAIKVANNPEAFDEQDNRTITTIERMLLEMSRSDNPADRRMFLEYAFGKVKDELEVKTDTIEVTIKNNEG